MSSNDDLFDAEQLMRMLEQLCYTYSKESEGGAKFPVPWHGLSLLAEQVRRKITKARERGAEQPVDERKSALCSSPLEARLNEHLDDFLDDDVLDNDEYINELKGRTPLAQRIKPSPVMSKKTINAANQARDLTAGTRRTGSAVSSQVDYE